MHVSLLISPRLVQSFNSRAMHLGANTMNFPTLMISINSDLNDVLSPSPSPNDIKWTHPDALKCGDKISVLLVVRV